jgi:hypothetical protein
MTAVRNALCATALALGLWVGLSAAVPDLALAAPPELSITAPPGGSFTANHFPVFTGTTSDNEDPVIVTVYAGPAIGGTVAEIITPLVGPAAGVWFAESAEFLGDGQYTAVVEQGAEGERGSSQPVTFTLDSKAPVVSMNTVAEFTTDPTPALLGNAGTAPGDQPSVTVRLFSGGSTGGTPVDEQVVSGAGGHWSYLAPTLADGVYTAQASQADEAGNEGLSALRTFTVDTTGPSVAVDALVSPTNDPKPSITGQMGAGPGDSSTVSVVVYHGADTGGAKAAEGTATDTGETSWSYAPHLGDGQYTIQATQSDEAGNTSASNTVTFTVDTAKPVVSVKDPPEYTNSTPTIEGTGGIAPGDDSTVTVRLYKGAGPSGTPVSTSTPALSGSSWSIVSPTTLADGVYTAQASQEDEAGNEGLSSPQTFTVDTVAPKVEVDPVLAWTNNSKPSITGHLGVASGDQGTVFVTIYQGAGTSGTKVEGTATITGKTSWSYSHQLEAGFEYTVQATQSDAAGNKGLSSPQTFTVDTTKPVVSVIGPTGYTTSKTPTIEGTGGNVSGDLTTVTVRLYKGTNPTGTPFATVTPTLSGGAWSFVAPSLTPDEAYTVQASQRDKAGNETASNAVTFIVDTEPPAVTVTTPSFNQEFSVQRPTFIGGVGTASGDSSTVTVQIYKEEPHEEVPVATISPVTANDKGVWEASEPNLANGNYTVAVEQSDAAGNIGKTERRRFSVHARHPIVTLAASVAVGGGVETYVGATPTFGGFAQSEPQDLPTVTLTIFEGPPSSGHVVFREAGERIGSVWRVGPVTGLRDGGTYTAQAEQKAAGEEAGVAESSFTVDGAAPHPVILAPVEGSSIGNTTINLTGSAGTSPRDDPAVTVDVFPGPGATGSPTETVTVPTAAGNWSAPLGTLPAGVYTAVAVQGDEVHNSGSSAPVTFSLSDPAPPAASFTWFPTAPHVGESISLVSTSTDPTSAIVGYGWSLAGAGVFTPGGQTLGTSFTTPGNHLVRLLVTDQNGASSSISETIPVTSVPVSLMQPFPVVRIAGSEGSAGVRIKLLSVQAPIGARVSIACKGKGCPAKLVSALAAASKGKHAPGSALITFKRFEHLLRPGVTLEIKISKSGEIGKFTRFVSRRHKLPTRSDSCLSPLSRPMACPST